MVIQVKGLHVPLVRVCTQRLPITAIVTVFTSPTTGLGSGWLGTQRRYKVWP